MGSVSRLWDAVLALSVASHRFCLALTVILVKGLLAQPSPEPWQSHLFSEIRNAALKRGRGLNTFLGEKNPPLTYLVTLLSITEYFNNMVLLYHSLALAAF